MTTPVDYYYDDEAAEPLNKRPARLLPIQTLGLYIYVIPILYYSAEYIYTVHTYK